MKSRSYKLLLISLLVLELVPASLFAQNQPGYITLLDKEVEATHSDSLIYSHDYIDSVQKLTEITKTNLCRKRIETISEELERFYDGNDLKNIMSIDSLDGLNVRTEPSLNAKKICALPYQLNVILTSLGPNDEIDGIKSAWCEILLPKYLWSSSKPEFGWVFGGYLYDKITTRRNFSINDQPLGYSEEEFASCNIQIPYSNLHLYDLIDGKSFFDLYSSRKKRNQPDFSKSKIHQADYYEYERSRALEILKLTQAGVIPYANDGYYEPFSSAIFQHFWDMVQEMRQIHPSGHVGVNLTYDSGIFTDETITIDFKDFWLTYKSPQNKKSYLAKIPENCREDFSINEYAGEGLEIHSFETNISDYPSPFITVLKKIYENPVIYHYEIFFYSITNNALIKFAQIITPPDFMEVHELSISNTYDERSVMISIFYLSAIYGIPHDDCITIKSLAEYPYFTVDKDQCNNFEIKD